MWRMDGVVQFLVRAVELLFAAGWLGSLLVIVISLIQTAMQGLKPDPPVAMTAPTLPPSSGRHL